MRSNEFAVVDLETTGFHSSGHDRIVEIAVVRLDSGGRVLREFSTLLNPGRDVGPTPVHGIRACDVVKAPRFEEIAGTLVEMIRDATFTAHNALFDWRFCQAEFSRMGYELPEAKLICTLKLAREAQLDTGSRKLGELCRYFGILNTGEHSALEDARATAELLGALRSRLSRRSGSSEISSLFLVGAGARSGAWPALSASGRTLVRGEARKERAERPSYISSLIGRLPAEDVDSPDFDGYFELLDRALEDRRITPEEIEGLESLASEAWLSKGQLATANCSYLLGLTRAAFEDGIVTDPELEDLEEVRHLLGISSKQFATIYSRAKADYKAGRLEKGSITPVGNLAGLEICFTGALSCSVNGRVATRQVAASLAEGHGMIVKKGVTKKLDILVVADPDSMSGKARKAHDYGIRVVAEPVFWRLLGIQVS